MLMFFSRPALILFLFFPLLMYHLNHDASWPNEHDDDDAVTADPMMMHAENVLHTGGLEDVPNVVTRVQKNGIIGCISHMTLSQDYHVKLISQATKEVNIRTCI